MSQISPNLPPSSGGVPSGGATSSQMQQINQFYQSQADISVLQSLAQDIESIEQAGQEPTAGATANQQLATQMASQEIQALSSLVSLLLHTPTSPPPSATTVASLQQMTSTLQTMSNGLQQNPPQLPSLDALNSLAPMLDQLNGFIPNYPPQTQMTYWTNQVQLFSQLSNSITESSQYTTQAPILNQFIQTEENLNQLGQSPPPPNTAALAQDLQNMVSVINSLPNLPTNIRSGVLTQLTAIQNQIGFAVSSSSGGNSLFTADHFESLGLMYQWTQEYLNQTPSASQSEAGWQQFVTTQMQTLFQPGQGIDSSLSALQTDLANFLNSAQLPTVWASLSSSSPPSFSDFLQLSSVTSLLSPNASSWAPSLQEFSSLYQQLNSEPDPKYISPLNINDFLGLQPFVNLVQQLINPTNWNTLTPAEQSYVSSVLNPLANGNTAFQLTPITESSPSFSLPQLLAMNQLSEWANQAPAGANLPAYLTGQLQQVSFSNTPISQAEQQQLQQMLSVSGQISTPLPIVASYQSPTQWTPFSQQTAGGTMWDNILLAVRQGSLPPLASNPDLIQPLNPQALVPSVSLFSAQALLLAPYESQLNSSISAFTQAAQAAAVEAAQASQTGGTSLQQEFANIILNHYMPGQESYLQDQAIQLNFSNWLGQQYNQIMNDTTGFSSASTLIAFAKLMSNPQSGTTGVFQGSYAMAATTLNNEKSAVSSDLQGAQQAQAVIQQLLQELTPPGTPGPDGTAQYLNPSPPNPALTASITQAKTTLQNELLSVNQAISNLTTLQQQLASITVAPPTNSTTYPANNYFQVNVTQGGSTAQISNAEIIELSQAENNAVQGGGSSIGDVGSLFKNTISYPSYHSLPSFAQTTPPTEPKEVPDGYQTKWEFNQPISPTLIQNSVANTQQTLSQEQSAIAAQLQQTNPSNQPLYSNLQQLQTLLNGLSVGNPPSEFGTVQNTPYAYPPIIVTNYPSNLTPSAAAALLYQGQPLSTATIQQIQNLESEINGQIPPAPVSGGLTNIAQDYSTQSQNASNQSQTQQMQLQLVMTEIQQEWTVVSTALQILNQVYMSVAQAISSP